MRDMIRRLEEDLETRDRKIDDLTRQISSLHTSMGQLEIEKENLQKLYKDAVEEKKVIISTKESQIKSLQDSNSEFQRQLRQQQDLVLSLQRKSSMGPTVASSYYPPTPSSGSSVCLIFPSYV